MELVRRLEKDKANNRQTNFGRSSLSASPLEKRLSRILYSTFLSNLWKWNKYEKEPLVFIITDRLVNIGVSSSSQTMNHVDQKGQYIQFLFSYLNLLKHLIHPLFVRSISAQHQMLSRAEVSHMQSSICTSKSTCTPGVLHRNLFFHIWAQSWINGNFVCFKNFQIGDLQIQDNCCSKWNCKAFAKLFSEMYWC